MNEPNPNDTPSDSSLPTPQEEMVIDTIETLRAISDPLRLRIIELLAEPCTAKEIAAKLEMGKTKLYYHLNLLEKHGILRVVRTRVVSGIIEKSYQVAALRFRPAAELLMGNEGDREQGLAIIDSIFGATRSEIARSIKAGHVGLNGIAREKRLFLTHLVMRLTPAQVEDLYARFEALLKEVEQYDNSHVGARPYALTMAFFPKVDDKEGGNKS